MAQLAGRCGGSLAGPSLTVSGGENKGIWRKLARHHIGVAAWRMGGAKIM